MQVLEIYVKDNNDYFYLSSGCVDRINVLCKPPTLKNVSLGEHVECNWCVSEEELRAVLALAPTVSDATNLMRLILALEGKCRRLNGYDYSDLTTTAGQWYDLKKQFRTDLEKHGVTSGTFILQAF
jgi:hypothetical protein